MKEHEQLAMNVLIGFVKHLAECHEFGLIPDNMLTTGQIYELAKVHAKDQFDVDLPELENLASKKFAASAYDGIWNSLEHGDRHTKLSLGTSCLVRLDCGQEETVVVPASVVNGAFWSLDELRRHRHGGKPFSNVIEWCLQPTNYKQKAYIHVREFLSRSEAIAALWAGETIRHSSYEGGEHLSIMNNDKIQLGDNPTERYPARRILDDINSDPCFANDWLVLKAL